MADAGPEGLPAEHRARYEALRSRFVAGLPARWGAIAGAPDAPSRTVALHTLAGAAATYGCAALAQAARHAEALSRDGDPVLLDAALAGVAQRIRDLAAA